MLAMFSGGKVGSMLYHPSDGTNHTFAYLRLGPFTPPDFCFTYPKDCSAGVSYAMWVNLLGDTGVQFQGFFTTHEWENSGVIVAWIPGNGLGFAVTNSQREDTAFISTSYFNTNYGFNIWVHYVFVYKYAEGESEAQDNMKIYMDGVLQPATKGKLKIKMPLDIDNEPYLSKQ